MFRSLSRKRRFGFTLVEVLVTTVVIGVLAAVVLPALAKQTSAADPARVASDLKNIKTGMEVFSNHLRPDFPGDLEDLVNQPTQSTSVVASAVTDDLALDGSRYANLTLWNGPYVSQTLSPGNVLTGKTPWRAGANGFYNNDLRICDIATLTACTVEVSSGAGAFVTLLIDDLSLNEALNIDKLLDGDLGAASGTFRYVTSGTVQAGFFYALPYTP